MDEYLQVLLDYVEEVRVGQRLRVMEDYQESVSRASDDYDRLTASLTGEQMEILDRFCAARDTMFLREGEALFTEGVAVGKWMAG